MKYMLLIASEPTDSGPQPGTPEFDEYMGQWFAYDAQIKESGAFVAGEALEDIDTATTVRHAGGATTLVDGPFAEAKEHLGGFYLVDVDTLDDALEWAKKLPVGSGSVEVRPVMPFDN